jgi:hypothetical protein
MDEQTGPYRISSKAFSPSSVDGALSGDLEQVLDDDGLPPTAMYPAVGDAVGAAAISIKDVRSAGASVEHDPVWTNWYHGSVFGTRNRRVRNGLQKFAVEIIPIDQIEATKLDSAWNAARANLPT